MADYTIPSDNRELQRVVLEADISHDYTIPSDNRELQLWWGVRKLARNYTIPSDNRELQLDVCKGTSSEIIPYQVITGNYNKWCAQIKFSGIIPYQVITGNYNTGYAAGQHYKLYHTK